MNYRELWFANNPSDHGWYTCAECGKKIRKADVDIDHIVPQKYGGKDKLYNLQCLCKHCNRSKQASLGDTLPDLYTTNKNRAVKAVKKNAAFVKKKLVEGVKSVAQKVTATKKETATVKKATTTKKDATAKKNAATTQKVTTAKKDASTKKVTTTKKVTATTKKDATTVKKKTSTKTTAATKQKK